MSRINFNACNTVGDIERLHAGELPASLLIEHDLSSARLQNGEIKVGEKQMLIFSTSRSGDYVLFEAEENIGQRLLLPFKMGELVVTSLVEPGDVFWSPDGYTLKSYTIKDLSEDETAFDGLLREANELPFSAPRLGLDRPLNSVAR